jgi:hypothetical protein
LDQPPENLDFVFRKFSAGGLADIAEEKSPERPPAKITGYIKESPVKTDQKKKPATAIRSSDVATVSSTNDK